jgi:MoxR-like ATPase
MEAIRTLFGSLVPDAAKIAADIESASAEVRADIIADVERRIGELLVPNRIEVSVNGADPTKVKGTVNPVFAEVLSWLASGCNVYLVGPAGCGKTTLARQVADALGVTFYTTGQVLSEHQVTGFVDAGGNYHTTPFRQAFEYGGVWLADEMDGWSPEATLAANAALANGHATFPDSPESIKAHPQFMVIAAANTWGHGADREYVGRNEMDAATLDRFVMVPMDYDRALESEIAGQYREWLELVWRVRSTAAAHRVQMMSGTRAVVKGVKGLAAGLPMDLVTRRVLKGDLDDATWSKVSA